MSVWFQSTPVIANGRIASGGFNIDFTKSFQSTPVIANGRIGDVVSAVPRRHPRFNPRPLLLTGESSPLTRRIPAPPRFQSTPVIANGRIGMGTGRLVDGVPVSIHARYC